MRRYYQMMADRYALDSPQLCGRQNWLVLPCMLRPNSDALALSNFDDALAQLGGESDAVVAHRDSDGEDGWLQLILVDPISPEATVAERIEGDLSFYGVLDLDDVFRRNAGEGDSASREKTTCKGPPDRIKVA